MFGARAPGFLDIDEVQHPLDRSVDFALKPIWRLAEPLFCVSSYILSSPARLHLRLEAKLSAAERATAPVRRGSGAELGAELRSVTAKTCNDLRNVFGKPAAECPDALLVRGSTSRVASMPLGFGRTWLLVATEGLVEAATEKQLRFIIGREIGRVWFHHGDVIAAWPWQRFARDAFVLPRYVVSRLLPRPREVSSQAVRHVGRGPREIQRCVDTLVGACDLYRGLSQGRWPGCTDLDVDGILGGSGTPFRGPGSFGPVDSVMVLCSRFRAPGGVWALATATAGSVAPHLLALALRLTADVEYRIKTGLRLSFWALGTWAGKLRAEVLSADRVGLIAAEGDEDAAVRAMVIANRSPTDAASLALLGVDQLVRQAEYLDYALPRPRFSPAPSLHTRVAELGAWARSPYGREVLAAAARASTVPSVSAK